MCLCLSTGTVPFLLRPGAGVHRVLLNDDERRRTWTGAEHLFTFRVIDSLLSLGSKPPLWWPFCCTHFVSLWMAQAKLAPHTALQRKRTNFKQKELLGAQHGEMLLLFLLYAYCIAFSVQVGSCMFWAPFKCLVSCHNPLPWTWRLMLFLLQYSVCTVDVAFPPCELQPQLWIPASFQWPCIPAQS